MHTLIKLLQDTPIFGGVSDETVGFILENSNKIHRNDGEYFFKEKEVSDSMFLLISGSVNVVRFWQGKYYVLNTLFSGDCFGEMAIVEHVHRSASVYALEHCNALEISNKTLLNLYQRDLKQFALLQMNLGREISRRLRSANERLFQHYIRTGSGHTAAFSDIPSPAKTA
ncbi:MAG: cyclic nucleotide-binding domain-containing protein [Gammaproteobacteria bacterium]|nr:cyclic nucleotide-binding domain-containing protein [Gammaproteobacteria bacterium]